MWGKILDNIKHIPSTVAGAAVVASGVLALPQVQALAAIDPAIAAILVKAGAISGGLAMIFTLGGQVKPQ
jgi:hypothetical protein